MALSSYVGSFNTGTDAAASTITVTGVGFQPKVVLFWWSGRTESVDTIGRASHYRGFGVACTTSDRRSVCSNSIDAGASSDSSMAHDNTACILSVDTASAIDGQIDLQSMDVDGFTLVVDDQMPRSLRVSFLALGGGSLTDVITGQFTEPAATGDADITSAGFQPDCVLFFSVGLATAAPSGGANSVMCLGAAVSSSQRATWTGRSRDAQTTMSTIMHATDDLCLARVGGAVGAVSARVDFVSFLSNGFRINWVERANTGIIYFYLALKGGNYRVDSLLTQTDTTTDIVEGSFGFQPSAALFVSHGTSESASDTTQVNDRLSVGAFSGLTTRGVQAVLDENGTADSEVTTAIEFDAVYANIKTDSTIDGLMDVKSIDSDGFTMIMDDADPSAAFVWYLAFGPAAAAASDAQFMTPNRGYW